MSNRTVAYGGIVAQIESLIRRHGPMTRAQISQAMGLDRTRVSSVITRMNRSSKTMPKRLFLTAYVYDHEKSRRYPRAVFDLGDKRNKPRPKPNRQETRRKYDQRVKLLMTGNSIFNLGLSRAQYLAKRREMT